MNPAMGRLPDELKERIPEMGASHGVPVERVRAEARYVDRASGMSWYIVEHDGEGRCFGLVSGRHAVMGEFTLEELEALEGVELDESFRPASLVELARQDEPLAELLPPPSENLVELE